MAHVEVVIAGPFLAACALLAWSGANKLARPGATRVAARAIGLPSSMLAVRVLGACELGAAVLGAIFGGWGALLVAAAYAALALVSLRLLLRAPDAPCGCLGAGSSNAVSRAHVGLNVGASGVALVAAFTGSPLSVLADQPLAGLPFLALVFCAAWLATLTVDALPALTRATHGGRS